MNPDDLELPDWIAKKKSIVLGLLLLTATAHADPIARFANGNVSITLHTGDCLLKSEITNLPRRAVWAQDGKEIEGCWGAIPQFGLVTMYFADKTVVALPKDLFDRVQGT